MKEWRMMGKKITEKEERGREAITNCLSGLTFAF
jgi:hypothetical protein